MPPITSNPSLVTVEVQMAAMHSELLTLKQEIAALKQEKAELELLLRAASNHANFGQQAALQQQVEAVQIQIDQARRAREVAEIVQSEYFQVLQTEVQQLRCQGEW